MLYDSAVQWCIFCADLFLTMQFCWGQHIKGFEDQKFASYETLDGEWEKKMILNMLLLRHPRKFCGDMVLIAKQEIYKKTSWKKLIEKLFVFCSTNCLYKLVCKTCDKSGINFGATTNMLINLRYLKIVKYRTLHKEIQDEIYFTLIHIHGKYVNSWWVNLACTR